MTTDVYFTAGCLAVTDARVLCNGRQRLAEELLRQLQRLPGVVSACLDLTAGRCQVCWTDAGLTSQRAADAFVAALQAALLAERSGAPARHHRRRLRPGAALVPVREPGSTEGPDLVRGPKRLLYLAAGAGSVVMTVVGVIVPGIPTVPFLLASSYFLARSSPRAHALLEATPLFGDMVREWDAHQALSRSSKRKLAIFTLVIIVLTVSLAQASPLAIAVVAVVAPACLIGIIRLPEIENADQDRLAVSEKTPPPPATVPFRLACPPGG